MQNPRLPALVADHREISNLQYESHNYFMSRYGMPLPANSYMKIYSFVSISYTQDTHSSPAGGSGMALVCQ